MSDHADTQASAPPAADREPIPARQAFRHFLAIGTRWMDNDVYGHVNNVVYYSYFDTVVNQFLIERGVLDIHAGDVIGLVVETSCRYFSSIAFPDTVHAGLRVVKIGRSSVQYEIGLFANDASQAAALGRFTHVYVDRATRRPTALPEPLRQTLQTLLA
ncbi:MAG: acyl-CoA thioesterase [Pirellulales bacterium]